MLEERESGGQTTYLGDGASIMDVEAHVEHSAFYIQCTAVWMLTQLPAEYRARIDIHKFAEAFSYVNKDNVRVGIPVQELAPGWQGKDTELGVVNPPLPENPTPALLAKLHNTDDLQSTHRYGNPKVTSAKEDFEKLCAVNTTQTPLLSACKPRPTGKPLLGRDAARLTGN